MGLDITKYKVISEEEHSYLPNMEKDSIIIKEYEAIEDDMINLLSHFKDKLVVIVKEVLGEYLTFYALPLKRIEYQSKGMNSGFGDCVDGRFVYDSGVLDNIKKYCKDNYNLKDWTIAEDEFIWFCN